MLCVWAEHAEPVKHYIDLWEICIRMPNISCGSDCQKQRAVSVWRWLGTVGDRDNNNDRKFRPPGQQGWCTHVKYKTKEEKGNMNNIKLLVKSIEPILALAICI